jgi:hypothetical protein
LLAGASFVCAYLYTIHAHRSYITRKLIITVLSQALSFERLHESSFNASIIILLRRGLAGAQTCKLNAVYDASGFERKVVEYFIGEKYGGHNGSAIVGKHFNRGMIYNERDV